MQGVSKIAFRESSHCAQRDEKRPPVLWRVKASSVCSTVSPSRRVTQGEWLKEDHTQSNPWTWWLKMFSAEHFLLDEKKRNPKKTTEKRHEESLGQRTLLCALTQFFVSLQQNIMQSFLIESSVVDSVVETSRETSWSELQHEYEQKEKKEEEKEEKQHESNIQTDIPRDCEWRCMTYFENPEDNFSLRERRR